LKPQAWRQGLPACLAPFVPYYGWQLGRPVSHRTN
jgi:hypothetical protein